MSSVEHTPYQNITIETVDQAIFDWFEYDVDAHVETPTQEIKKVPIIFASGERWATARDQRGLRDKNGLLILPIVSIRRTGLDRSRNMSSLGIEERRLTISRIVSGKTNTLQNAISSREISARQSKGKVIHEIVSVPFPDSYVTTYEIVIQTQYITQMNEILEKIFDKFDLQNQFVMAVRGSEFDRPEESLNRRVGSDTQFTSKETIKGFYFVGFVETDLSDTGNFEEFTDQERIVKYSFSVTVPTYLNLEPQGELPALQTQLSAYEFKFADETSTFVEDPDELALIFSFKRPK
jgi:hypothetical protein